MSTVCAISTPAAVGGISVIRISGEKALEIAERVFKPVYPVVKVSEMKGYTAAYGRIYDGSQKITFFLNFFLKENFKGKTKSR